MIRKELPSSLIFSSALACLLVYFEYYYVTINGIPFRELDQTGIMGTPPYFLFPLAPIIIFAAFLPVINLVASKHVYSLQINRELGTSVANFLWALTLYDILFYVLRAFYPLPTDPLGGFWITQGEDSFMGLTNLFGTLLPTWYFVTIPLVLSIYIAYYIS